MFRYPTRTYISSETNIEDGIKEIISALVVRNVKEMTIGELTSIDLLFVDSIFQEAKADLKSHYVELKDFSIVEFVRYTENVQVADDGEAEVSVENVEEEEVTVEDETVVHNENPDFDVDLGGENGSQDEAVVGVDDDIETRSYIITGCSKSLPPLSGPKVGMPK